jgi:ATP-dependent Clp protease ATP-binding subunit ClpC
MFERFTNQSRRAVVLAQEESRRLDHTYIGTEHLLAGLTREEQGAAGRALESAGVSVSAVRDAIETLVGRGQQAPSSHIPFTPQAKKCLELAFREALQLGHNYIGTGDVLLGLISKSDSVAVQVLGELGTDIEQLRAQVVLEMEERREDPGGSPLPPPRQLPLTEAMLGLLDTIDERLTAIERHLGIASGPAAEAESPGGNVRPPS